jgi:hypothetical protein
MIGPLRCFREIWRVVHVRLVNVLCTLVHSAAHGLGLSIWPYVLNMVIDQSIMYSPYSFQIRLHGITEGSLVCPPPLLQTLTASMPWPTISRSLVWVSPQENQWNLSPIPLDGQGRFSPRQMFGGMAYCLPTRWARKIQSKANVRWHDLLFADQRS